jgi:hypothetical protein
VGGNRSHLQHVPSAVPAGADALKFGEYHWMQKLAWILFGPRGWRTLFFTSLTQ